MREDYQLDGPTEKIQIELEAAVVGKLKQMVDHTTLSNSEITNTALKRFIAQHKDFLPSEFI